MHMPVVMKLIQYLYNEDFLYEDVIMQKCLSLEIFYRNLAAVSPTVFQL